MRIFVLGSFIQACCWQVKHLPKWGETLVASALSIEAGGKGLNVAIGTRRLGADVTVLLGIGYDQAGDGLMRLLAQEGLVTRHVWRLAKQSGYGAGLIAKEGENVIAIYPGPNQLLTAAHVQAAQADIGRADWVYAQLETAMVAIVAAFRLAKLSGVCTVLNPSPWQSLPQELLDVTDILIVNATEAQNLLALAMPLPGSLQECFSGLEMVMGTLWLRWGGELLVVTLGALGSLAFSRDGQTYCAPAFAVQSVDSVGAGDAFASGFCVELCQRRQIQQALRYGNACGAMTASRLGVLAALPCRATVEAFLADYG